MRQGAVAGLHHLGFEGGEQLGVLVHVGGTLDLNRRLPRTQIAEGAREMRRGWR